MKNRTNKTYLPAVRLALCAGVLLLAACTKDNTPGLPEYTNTQIIPQAQLPALGVEQEPGFESRGAQTRAAADPTQAMTLLFARSDETGNGTDTFGAYSTTPLTATRAAGTGAQTLTFATPQYYIANNARSRFTGWWPAPTSFTGGVASWTIDGSQDILTAAAQEGNVETPMPAIAFEHRLSKLSFEVVASNATTISSWGTISGVNVLAQPTTCTYTLASGAATGAVAMSGSTTYAVKNFASGVLTTTATARGDAMFVATSDTNVALSLSVVSSTRGTVTVTVPTRTYQAGKAYKLTLSFRGTTVAVSVVPWNDITSDDEMGNPEIGSMSINGVIYWINAADKTNYKVVSVIAAPRLLPWAINLYYWIGPSAQSDTDGKANSAAIKAAFDKKQALYEPITEATFEEAFPAAAWCYNYKGIDGSDPVGTWYLPAKTDLQYLYCAYNGYAPISWESDINSSLPLVPAAQAVFNKYLADAGGTDIEVDDGFWSSSEWQYRKHPWAFGMFNSNTIDDARTVSYRVRCIRENYSAPVAK